MRVLSTVDVVVETNVTMLISGFPGAMSGGRIGAMGQGRLVFLRVHHGEGFHILPGILCSSSVRSPGGIDAGGFFVPGRACLSVSRVPLLQCLENVRVGRERYA